MLHLNVPVQAYELASKKEWLDFWWGGWVDWGEQAGQGGGDQAWEPLLAASMVCAHLFNQKQFSCSNPHHDPFTFGSTSNHEKWHSINHL